MLASSVRATPGVDAPDDTIDGFPEFAFTVDTINDPTVTRQLRALAKTIVASHQTSNKIIGFEAHGHADVTLRLPPGPSVIGPSWRSAEIARKTPNNCFSE